MNDVIKWDGVSSIQHEPIIKHTLLHIMNDKEKELARTTSYGDLGKEMQKNHGCDADDPMCHYGLWMSEVYELKDKIVIEIRDLHVTYEMTWNKAAKAIHRWVHEESSSNVPAVESDAVLSEEYAKAVKLDLNIKANAQTAQMSLYEVCKGLKEMRDGKLYKQLGYTSFEAYCEDEVGIKRHMAYKYAAVADLKNVELTQHFGIEKLYLLSKLDEDQRVEILENTDVENTTVKKLKAEIEQLKSEQSTLSANYDRMSSDYLEIGDKLADAELKLQKSEEYREELCDENDKMSLRISELLAEVDDLKDRLIDVTYSDANNKEIENMRKAMDKCDRDWRNKYDELQDSNIKQVQELNIKHTEEMNKLKAEYEDKIKDATSGTPEDGPNVIMQTYAPYRTLLQKWWSDLEHFIIMQDDRPKRYCVNETTAVIRRILAKLEEMLEED